MSWPLRFTCRIQSPANEIGDRCDYVHTDTVHENGTVETVVRGIADGEYFDQKKTWKTELTMPLNAESIRAARRSSGWTEVQS